MREEAILDAAHQLLGKFGYEEMTMDVVAAEVGIAKASLYKHFPSKEKLAARTMTRLFERTMTRLTGLAPALPAVEKLRLMLEWVLQERLKGSIPHLPSTNGALEHSLMTDEHYLAALFTLNAALSALVEQAKADGALSRELPTDYIVTTIYARSCDPTLDYMQRGNSYSPEEIVRLMLHAFFVGIAATQGANASVGVAASRVASAQAPPAS